MHVCELWANESVCVQLHSMFCQWHTALHRYKNKQQFVWSMCICAMFKYIQHTNLARNGFFVILNSFLYCSPSLSLSLCSIFRFSNFEQTISLCSECEVSKWTGEEDGKCNVERRIDCLGENKPEIRIIIAINTVPNYKISNHRTTYARALCVCAWWCHGPIGHISLSHIVTIVMLRSVC